MVRLKHRYLLVNFLYPQQQAPGLKISGDVPDFAKFHLPSSDKLNAGLLIKIIREGIADLFGDYGAGMTSGTLSIKYFSPATSTAIIRVSRNHYRFVWAALSFITRLPHPINSDCVVQVVHVSGTMRKAQEEAIRQAKQFVVKIRQEAGDNTVGVDALLSRVSGGVDADMAQNIEDTPMHGVDDDSSGDSDA